MTSLDVDSTVKHFLSSGCDFAVGMLARLVQDCQYFLGYGMCNENVLWAKDVVLHTQLMLKLYSELPVKPDFITREGIIAYGENMKSALRRKNNAC